MIEGIVEWLENIVLTVGYPGVFFTVALESLFTPIPSEVLMPFLGYMIYQGKLNLYLTILVATVGSYIGTLPFHVIGYLGKDYIEKFLRKYGKYLFISDSAIDKVFVMFEKHGSKIVFLGRMIPTVRSLISFPAGVAKMNFALFSLYSLAGSLVWTAALVLLGFFLGNNWQKAIQWISGYEKVVLVLLGIGLIAYIVYFVYKRFFAKKDTYK